MYLSKHTNTHIVYCFISFLYATYTHPYKCGFIHISCVHVSSKPQISLAPPLVNTQEYTPLNTIGCLFKLVIQNVVIPIPLYATTPVGLPHVI